MESKKSLWDILEKYDGNSEYVDFCDSLSKFIQSKEDNVDILNVYVGLSKIDREDKVKIDNVIGAQIDSFLFSI
jgi:hypothetical protein